MVGISSYPVDVWIPGKGTRDSKTYPCSMLSLFTGFLDPVTCTTWHFKGLNPISHMVSHADKMLRSFWSVELSSSLSNVRYSKQSYLGADLIGQIIFCFIGPGSRCIGPVNLALSQAAEMQQTTNISINIIQPEPAYSPGDIIRTIQQLANYWSQLGSSKKIEHQCNKKWAKILSMNFFQKLLICHVCFHRWIMSGEPRTLWSWCSDLLSR